MPKELWIVFIAIFLLVLIVLVGSVITLSIIKPKRRSLLETSILEEEKYPGIMDFYQTYLTKSYTIESRYNYKIAVYFLKNNQDTDKYIVMSHGHTYTHHGCLKYARMMMRYGYNIVLYDQRFHGDSGGKFTSLGHYEKYDLYDVITDTFNRFGQEIELGTYGESMGSSTVLLEAEIDKRVKYIFSDCGFTDLRTLVGEILQRKSKKGSKILLLLTSLLFKIYTGVSISRISPIKALNSIDVPIFFAHGLDDDFILCKHSEEMYNSYKNKKHLFLAGNESGHACSYLKDRELYEKNIDEFINELNT